MIDSCIESVKTIKSVIIFSTFLAMSTAFEINKVYSTSEYRRMVWDWAQAAERNGDWFYPTQGRSFLAKRRWHAYLHLILVVDPFKEYNVLQFKNLVEGFQSFALMVERIDCYFFHLTKDSPYVLLLKLLKRFNSHDLSSLCVCDIAGAVEHILQVNTEKPPITLRIKTHQEPHRFPCVCRERPRPNEISTLAMLPAFIPGTIFQDHHVKCLPESTLKELSAEELKLCQEPTSSSSSMSSEAWNVFQGTAFAPALKRAIVVPWEHDSLVLPPEPKPFEDPFRTPEKPRKPQVAPGAPLRQRRPDTPIPPSLSPREAAENPELEVTRESAEPSSPKSPVYRPKTPDYYPTVFPSPFFGTTG